ncbi:hypothetical protein TNCT_337921 [Trichonephila clavata]|uniref:Uncharacterized protein n=1 Tax=Trichonephila clavata TaxID=2740835 RepID=A0A8X6J8L3_TRICU|nr:hypothetical protein TNCT_337921 [Trichonephila clavata]
MKSCDSRRKIYLVQKVLPERSCPYDLSSRRPFTEKQEQIRKGRVLSFKSRSKGATIKGTHAERRSPSVQDQSENYPTVEALNEDAGGKETPPLVPPPTPGPTPATPRAKIKI